MGRPKKAYEKVSVNVEPGLTKKAKIRAAKEGITFSYLVNQAVIMYLKISKNNS